MKSTAFFTLFLATITLTGCSESAVEEFTFRKFMERNLKEDCGENKFCKEAVSDQIKTCMEHANWDVLLEKEESDPVFAEFHSIFYSCFKYKDGSQVFN